MRKMLRQGMKPTAVNRQNQGEEGRAYYFTKILPLSFEAAVIKVSKELAKGGFGILTDIDVQGALKNKLGVDFRQYRILGACNPPFGRSHYFSDGESPPLPRKFSTVTPGAR
jgi:hypothetical protein